MSQPNEFKENTTKSDMIRHPSSRRSVGGQPASAAAAQAPLRDTSVRAASPHIDASHDTNSHQGRAHRAARATPAGTVDTTLQIATDHEASRPATSTKRSRVRSHAQSPARSQAQPILNIAPRQVVVDALTQLGADATIAMINAREQELFAAGYAINVDDVLPFTHAAAVRAIGTTVEDLEAARTLLEFTLSEEKADEEMERGIADLRAKARARRMAEEE